ncbi:MaoC/PaaZ C-terminal domain-containing protein [Limnobacter sp.]|uniref:MaoC/PaaZ C-terminal domain-containing protein n=1 Tax=Limnobacter sp. TaxID=2003368 RepID=UPI002FE3A8DF
MSVNDTLKAAAKFFELSEFPNGKALLLKAATTSNKKPKPDTQAARLGARVKKVFIDREWVRKYNAVCGFKEDDISLTAPQVVASPLHMFLLSRPEHPMPMLGMVHLHNSIDCIKPLEYGTTYDVLVRVGETRSISLGLEFDVHTQFLVGEEVHWSSVMTILCRVKGMPKPSVKSVPAEPLSALGARYVAVKVPENQGRKYARVSNDYNPIHLYAQTAKMFGFRQAIVHGMWTAAKTLSIVEAGLGSRARKFDLSFKQPVFLPSGIAVKHVTAAGASKFEVLAERDSKVLMVGSIEA